MEQILIDSDGNILESIDNISESRLIEMPTYTHCLAIPNINPVNQADNNATGERLYILILPELCEPALLIRHSAFNAVPVADELRDYRLRQKR
ncbi:MAG: hypothetical protein LUE20_02275 [Oscillospiraceae bacterium]|nr:hypothetical protein [Oscillospiraceae bacterium]